MKIESGKLFSKVFNVTGTANGIIIELTDYDIKFILLN